MVPLHLYSLVKFLLWIYVYNKERCSRDNALPNRIQKWCKQNQKSFCLHQGLNLDHYDKWRMQFYSLCLGQDLAFHSWLQGLIEMKLIILLKLSLLNYNSQLLFWSFLLVFVAPYCFLLSYKYGVCHLAQRKVSQRRFNQEIPV